jgi:hypothetical protein
MEHLNLEHLNLEQLARLVDEPPTPEERAILDSDPDLRRELEALRAQAAALKDLPAVLPPPDSWHDLEDKLRSAGLIRGEPAMPGLWRKWMQVAAALVLFTGGTAFGWTAAGRDSQIPSGREAGDAAAAAQTASFASLDDARVAVLAAEEEWTWAFNEYRRLFDAQNLPRTPTNPARRLAALEALVATTQASVAEFPEDQFLNGFLLNTMWERQQTLRQIGRDNWH